jgi:tetratricopeptide (TPR) repeat protein
MPEALALARDVAAALAHAHGRGVVHRDIKPENLMFAESGAIQVTDFGLARLAHASQLTRDGATMGTAGYMAPESIAGEGGAKADVFALGVTLYEMLTGRMPFRADTPLAMMYAIANTDPVPLRESRRGELPAEIEAVVAGMLARAPEQRLDASAAAARLSALTGVAFQDSAPTIVPESGAPAAHFDSSAPTMAPRAAAMASARRPLVWAGVGIGLAALAWVGWSFVRGVHPRNVSDADRVHARALADESANFLTQGQLDSAQARAESALRIDPNSANGRINLAQVLRQRGQPTQAAALLTEVTRQDAAEPRLRAVAWDALGDMAIDDRTWPEAVSALQKSFAIDSTERAYSQLGYALVRASRPSDALTLLRRGLASFPGSAALHKNAGYALLKLDSLPQARREADRALALDPAFTPALGLRARLEARAGDAASAQRDWRAYVAAGPAASDSAEVAADLAQSGENAHQRP